MVAENRRVYIFLVCLLFMGLTLGTVPTSIPQFLLSGYWLLTGKFKEKFRNFFKHKEFVLWSILWIWHVVAMLWTDNTLVGWNDIRIKIPMLLVPLLIGSFKPFEFKELRWVVFFFLIGLTINLFWSNTYMWRHHPIDPRVASRFMSHIRLGFLIITGILLMVYLYLKERKLLGVYVMLVLFFTYSIINLGILSAIAFALACTPFVMFLFLKHTGKIKYFAFCSSLALILISVVYALNFYDDFFREKNIPYNIVNHEAKYIHYSQLHLIENGFNAGINIASDELLRVWNHRFPERPINIYEHKFFGLIRYMASLGLSKDSAGFSKLTNADISNIMNGISNYKYPKLSGIDKKLYEMFYSLRQIYYLKKNSGSSAGMRFYYWQTGMKVIKENWLMGCGTGDVLDEMKKIFIKDGIHPEWMKRPHQQFISIWAALGIIGMALFIGALAFPLLFVYERKSVVFFLIWLGFIISFLYEDTLETQTGLSYVIFFYVLMSLYIKKE